MDTIVLVGHGSLPQAMKASAEMIMGPCPQVRTVCLSADDGADQLEEKLAALDGELAESTRITVLADLLGGSPCNAALARYRSDGRASVISGMNLAMVLSAVSDDADAGALARAGREGVHDVKAYAAGTEQSVESPAAAAKPAPDGSKPQQIVGVRIDSRGIHGQVATAWVPNLDVDRIIVVDDIAVRDETQKIGFKMASPAGVKLSILTCRKAAERLGNDHSYPGERLFVVMTRVESLDTLDKLGFRFKAVNVGNVPSRPDTTGYAKCVNLTDHEADILRHAAQEGCRLTARQVPADPEADFAPALNR